MSESITHKLVHAQIDNHGRTAMTSEDALKLIMGVDPWGEPPPYPKSSGLAGRMHNPNPQQKEETMSDSINIHLDEDEIQRARDGDWEWINGKIRDLLPPLPAAIAVGLKFKYCDEIRTVINVGPDSQEPRIAIVQFANGRTEQISVQTLQSGLTGQTYTLVTDDEDEVTTE